MTRTVVSRQDAARPPLPARIAALENRIARLRAVLARLGRTSSSPTAAAAGGRGGAEKSLLAAGDRPSASATADDARRADRGAEDPLRDQPQPETEYVADLLGRDTDMMRRQRHGVQRLGLQRCRLRRTPGDYYAWTLEQRRAYLRAPSVSHLCKSMLMVNKKAPGLAQGKAPADRFYASHYLVIYQYEVKFVNEKLIEFLRLAVPPPAPPKKRFNFRVASEADNDLLSGFVHNAVSPVGFRHPLEVPFVLDQRIVDTVDFIWLGGGEPDVKLALSVAEFVKVFDPIVAPVTGAAADTVED